MQGCLQLIRLPRKTTLKSLNFSRVTPGSASSRIGGPPPERSTVNPEHPYARRGGLMRVAPNVDTAAFQLRAIPKDCLTLPEPKDMIRGPAPARWPHDRRLNMSILNIAPKATIHKKAVVRRAVTRRVHCAFSLIVTRGADCARDAEGRNVLVFREKDIGAHWVAQDWTYLLWPKLEAYLMPWPELVQCGRTALTSVLQQMRKFEEKVDKLRSFDRPSKPTKQQSLISHLRAQVSSPKPPSATLLQAEESSTEDLIIADTTTFDTDTLTPTTDSLIFTAQTTTSKDSATSAAVPRIPRDIPVAGTSLPPSREPIMSLPPRKPIVILRPSDAARPSTKSSRTPELPANRGAGAKGLHTSAIASQNRSTPNHLPPPPPEKPKTTSKNAPNSTDDTRLADYQTALDDVISAQLWVERPSVMHPVQPDPDPSQSAAAKVQGARRWVERSSFVRALVEQEEAREQGAREAQKRVLQQLGFRVDSHPSTSTSASPVSEDVPLSPASKEAKPSALSLLHTDAAAAGNTKARKQPKTAKLVERLIALKAQEESSQKSQDEVLKNMVTSLQQMGVTESEDTTTDALWSRPVEPPVSVTERVQVLGEEVERFAQEVEQYEQQKLVSRASKLLDRVHALEENIRKMSKWISESALLEEIQRQGRAVRALQERIEHMTGEMARTKASGSVRAVLHTSWKRQTQTLARQFPPGDLPNKRGLCTYTRAFSFSAPLYARRKVRPRGSPGAPRDPRRRAIDAEDRRLLEEIYKIRDVNASDNMEEKGKESEAAGEKENVTEDGKQGQEKEKASNAGLAAMEKWEEDVWEDVFSSLSQNRLDLTGESRRHALTRPLPSPGPPDYESEKNEDSLPPASRQLDDIQRLLRLDPAQSKAGTKAEGVSSKDPLAWLLDPQGVSSHFSTEPTPAAGLTDKSKAARSRQQNFDSFSDAKKRKNKGTVAKQPKLKSTAKWPDASPHPSVDSSLAGNTDLDASQTSDNAKGSFLNKLFSTKPVVRPPPPKPRRRP